VHSLDSPDHAGGWCVLDNLETYLVAGHQAEDISDGIPPYAEAAFREEWPDMDQTAGMTDETWN